MDTRESKVQLQDCFNLMLGIWLFVSPWVLKYPPEASGAAWTAHLVGAGIFLCAMFELIFPILKVELVIASLGAWLGAYALLATPQDVMAAYANALICGIGVVSVSVWAYMQERNYMKWRDQHHMAY